MILKIYTLLTFNVLLFNAVISLDYRLPNDLHKMKFVDCEFIKPNYIIHIMKCVSSSADKGYRQIHYVTIKIIEIPIVLIASYFLFVRINI